MLLAIVIGLLVVLASRLIHRLKLIDNLPGMRPLFHPLGLGALSLHVGGTLDCGGSGNGAAHTHDIISMVPLLVGAPCYYTSSVDVMKQLLQSESKTHLLKPNWLTSTLLLWGNNVFSANGDTWKRHRRILAPAFTTKTYESVVSETITTFSEMVAAEGWEAMDDVLVSDFGRLPFKLGLIIMARCGFGLPIAWNETITDGEFNFEDDLRYIAATRYARVRLPSWVYKLGLKRIEKLEKVWKTMASFMDKLLFARKKELSGLTSEAGHPGDIFSRLVAAMDGDEKIGLDHPEVPRLCQGPTKQLSLAFYSRQQLQFCLGFYFGQSKAVKLKSSYGITAVMFDCAAVSEEIACRSVAEAFLVGNTVMLLFAGHETTAATVVATLGFLAIHQEEQAAAYTEITAMIPSTREPKLDDLFNMPHLLACFHEALRIFPSAMLIAREMTNDVSVRIERPLKMVVVLKKGSLVINEMIAIHHNPQDFPEPEEYRPARWYGVPDSELSMFGLGPRVCIGKKFGQTMALCFLVLLLRDWRVDIDLHFGETRPQYEERVMGKARRIGFAFGCDPLTLRLKRRN
ncbi:cytochrome P450 [Mycena crocata]|nr:cytochrome P450 [Mycena crocata]